MLVEERLHEGVVHLGVAGGLGVNEEGDHGDLDHVEEWHTPVEERLHHQHERGEQAQHQPVVQPSLLGGHVLRLHRLERLVARVQHADDDHGDAGEEIGDQRSHHRVGGGLFNAHERCHKRRRVP